MPVAGTPVIIHLIRRLSAQGIHDIAINLHHHADQMREVLGDGSRFGVRLYFSYEEHLLDSGGGVRKAMMLLPGNGWFAVHNADVLSDIDVRDLAGFAGACGARACLALVANPSHHPDGDYGLQNDLVVPKEEGLPAYTYAGVAAMHESVLSGYKPDVPFPLKDVFSDLQKRGELCGKLHHGMWMDIGRPRDWLNASRLLGAHEF
jgi:MurNAc alpha-1-phosphate uridylyltransferase